VTELAVEPNLQILRRHRRSLLLRLEHPHRSTLENHVHRTPRLGRRRSLNLRIGITLSGCGIAQHIQAEEPAKQQAAQSAQLVQQSKTAVAACDAEFPAGNPKTAVARRKCINDGFAIRLPTFGLDQDLVRAVLADSMVIAEKVQNGKMTIAEGNAAIGEKWAVAESQQRANSKNSVLAQQSAAAAQQQAAAPANGAAVTPVDLPNFTCIQNGNTVTCN
jgi:hypothetical protein